MSPKRPTFLSLVFACICISKSLLIEKMIERISRYLQFLQFAKNIAPVQLFHCANPEFVQEFVHFMIDRQGVKAIICVAT